MTSGESSFEADGGHFRREGGVTLKTPVARDTTGVFDGKDCWSTA
jgi:hypothetical protein